MIMIINCRSGNGLSLLLLRRINSAFKNLTHLNLNVLAKENDNEAELFLRNIFREMAQLEGLRLLIRDAEKVEWDGVLLGMKQKGDAAVLKI